MKTNQFLILTLCVSAALSVSKAHSQTFDTTLLEVVPGLESNGTITGDSGFQMWRAGVSQFEDLTFEAFCVEPSVSQDYGDMLTYTVQDIGDLSNNILIARIVGGYLDSDQSDLQAAAFQWAIWEVTNELSAAYNLFDGDVRLQNSLGYPNSEDIALLGNTILSNAVNGNYAPVALTYLVSQNGQDVVTWQVVPEPSVAGLTALSALFLLRRRR